MVAPIVASALYAGMQMQTKGMSCLPTDQTHTLKDILETALEGMFGHSPSISSLRNLLAQVLVLQILMNLFPQVVRVKVDGNLAPNFIKPLQA